MLVKRIIEERLSVEILTISRLSGGDINEVYHYKSTSGDYVIKCNDRLKFPQMLGKEAQGLKFLKEHGLRTPLVFDHFEYLDRQFLVLEYIEEGMKGENFWSDFAENLAKLHQKSHSRFGLDYNNFIGSLIQQNDQFSRWEDFFISKRLKPLIKRAFDQKKLTKKHLNYFERFFTVFAELVPKEAPSLLHGDLWSGNLLCNTKQEALFIDPAIYYGHREIDISMTRMFGGFDANYLDSYNDRFPLEKGWEKRIPIHNLYPQLVHLVLFGQAYLRGVENVIERY